MKPQPLLLLAAVITESENKKLPFRPLSAVTHSRRHLSEAFLVFYEINPTVCEIIHSLLFLLYKIPRMLRICSFNYQKAEISLPREKLKLKLKQL